MAVVYVVLDVHEINNETRRWSFYEFEWCNLLLQMKSLELLVKEHSAKLLNAGIWRGLL